MPVLQVAIDARPASAGAAQFSQAAQAIKNASRDVEGATHGVQRGVDSVGAAVSAVKKVLLEFAALAGITLSIRYAWQEIVRFDSAVSSMGRTTHLQGQALDEMTEAILGVSRRIPVAAQELARIGEIAGRMGVRGRADIMAFIEPVARLSAVTGEPIDALAIGLSRLTMITGEGVKVIGPLAGVLHELEETSSSSASEILTAAQAIARTSSGFHATAAEAAALASVVAQVSGRIQFAGQAVSDTMKVFKEAINAGGPQLQAWLDLTGKSQNELANMFQGRPLDALQLLLGSLHKVSDAGGDVAQVIRLLGISSDQAAMVLPALANNSDRVAEAIQRAGEGMTGFNQIEISDKLSNQMKIIGNNIDALILKMVGETGLLADFKKMLKGMTQALAGDDIGLAAQIFWKTMELEWAKGMGFLTSKWNEFQPIFDEFGRRIVQTLVEIGMTAGGALVSAIADGMSTLGVRLDYANAKTQATNLLNQALVLAGNEESAGRLDRQGYYSAVSAAHKVFDEKKAKLDADEIMQLAGMRSTATKSIMNNLPSNLKGIWDNPFPVSNAPTPVADAWTAMIQSTTEERDRLVALAKAAASQPATMPTSMPATFPSSTIGGSTSGGQAATQVYRTMTAEMAKRVQGYQDEARVLTAVQPLRERETEQLLAETMAVKEYPRGSAAWTAAVKEQMDSYDALNHARGRDEFEKYLQDIDDEIALLRLDNDTRERGIELLKMARSLQGRGFAEDEITAALKTQNERMKAVQEMKKFKETADQIGGAFDDAFLGIITGTKKVGEAFASLASEIARIVMHNLVTKPLGDLISGGIMGMLGGGWGGGGALPGIGDHGLALGGVFDQGRAVRTFADGGIIGAPTFFHFASGVGVMGEAGPEAIMPLSRGADGSLGVKAQAGSPSLALQINVINNSATPVKARQQGQPQFDGKKWVTSVVLEDISNYGPIRQAMKGIQ